MSTHQKYTASYESDCSRRGPQTPSFFVQNEFTNKWNTTCKSLLEVSSQMSLYQPGYRKKDQDSFDSKTTRTKNQKRDHGKTSDMETSESCHRFRVVQCLDTATAARNVVTLCPADMEKWPTPLYVKVKGMVLLAEPHHAIKPGTIAMNKIQRGSLSLSIGQVVSFIIHPVETEEKIDQVTVLCKLVVELGHRSSHPNPHPSLNTKSNANLNPTPTPDPSCLLHSPVAVNTESLDVGSTPNMGPSIASDTGHDPCIAGQSTLGDSRVKSTPAYLQWDKSRVQESLAALFAGHVWTKNQSILWEYEEKPWILTVSDILLEDYGQANVSAESGIFTPTTTVLFEHKNRGR